MPKIIENLKDDILNEAMAILDSEGLEGLSIRRISTRLNIAPSTIYNYYKNKDAVIGALTKKRWEDALSNIDRTLENVENIHGEEMVKVMDLIVDELRGTLRKLMVFHASSADSLQNSREHAAEHLQMLACELEKRVDKIFGENPDNEKVRIMTNLIFACIYNNNLKFSDIYNTITSI